MDVFFCTLLFFDRFSDFDPLFEIRLQGPFSVDFRDLFLMMFSLKIPDQTKNSWGGGFKHFLFSSLFGEDSHFDYSIFQMGWFNHQPA